jgi:uncharacterized damage-inducible protein DinB
MSANMADRYRRWFEYEKDAHRRVLQSIHAAADAERAAPSFQKAVDLFAHMMAARLLWLFRFGAATEPPTELFPQRVPVDVLDSLAEEMHTAWTAYFDRLDEAEAARVFEYSSLDGPRYLNSVEDILTQLFGHSWYHRGQIALLLRSCGAEPAPTDFVFWCRELIST